MRLPSLFCLFALIIIFGSCKTQRTTSYYYVENANDTTGKDLVTNYEPLIQKNDLLSIQVYSAATDPMIDQLYNLANTTSGSSSGGSAVTGFLVDQNGNIEYPRIGTIHVEGLTKQQLADIIKGKLAEELTRPSVIIRFLNFRITMLGEIGSPGTKSIPYEKVTILEAIGLAGDIPLTGKKEAVRVIREVNGQREFGVIDLTSTKMFESPYFNLQQNDVIIVDPTRARIRTNEQSIVLQRITFALTFVTTAALLYNLFK